MGAKGRRIQKKSQQNVDLPQASGSKHRLTTNAPDRYKIRSRALPRFSYKVSPLCHFLSNSPPISPFCALGRKASSVYLTVIRHLMPQQTTCRAVLHSASRTICAKQPCVCECCHCRLPSYAPGITSSFSLWIEFLIAGTIPPTNMGKSLTLTSRKVHRHALIYSKVLDYRKRLRLNRNVIVKN
jgi:hypothetical protein